MFGSAAAFVCLGPSFGALIQSGECDVGHPVEEFPSKVALRTGQIRIAVFRHKRIVAGLMRRDKG